MHADPLRRSLVELVQELSTASLHFSDRAAGAHGLHRSDLQALRVLATAREGGEPPVTASALAHALTLSPSATTALADRLERAGHVRRVRDVDDRRRVGLEMTPSAGEEARAMFGPLAAQLASMMEDFDEDELAVVERFLVAAIRTVNDQPGS